MGPSAAAALDEDALRLWTRSLDTRTIALALIAATSWFIPGMQDQRLAVVLLLAVFVIPYNVALTVRLHRRRCLDRWMPLSDLLGAAGFAAILPDAWPAVVAVAVADIGLSVVMFGRRTALLSTGLGAVALTLAGLRVEGGVGVGVSGFLASAGLVIWTVGFVNSNERLLRQRFTALVNGVDGIVWEMEAGTRRMTFVNRQAQEILGWTREQVEDPVYWRMQLHPDDEMTRVTERGPNGGAEYRVRHADGRWVWLRDQATLERDASGEPRTYRGLSVDVTQQHEAALAMQQYVDIVEQLQLSLIVWRLVDPADPLSVTVASANPAAEALWERSAASMVGRRLVELWPGTTGDRFAEMITHTIRSGRPTEVEEVPFQRRDGSDAWFSLRMFPLPGSCAGLVTEDVTDARQASEALRHQALHDSLTGLPNRALMRDRLATALAAARRTGQPVALLVLDLDQFKEINDTLGHPTGDRLLQQVSARLGNVLRHCDTVARLGGDEFAVLLTVDASRAGAENVAVRIGEALAEPFELDGMAVQTAASIGIVLSPEHGVEAGLLVQRADIAMYNAKRNGRGYAFYAAEDDRSSLRRLSLVGELRQAIEREELVLHFQPQVDVVSEDVVAVEALVRWQHPEHGMLPPGEFIALAEVSGIIQPLTRWVMRAAVQQAAVFARQGTPLVVAVNVSARNLYEPDLVSGIATDLRECGVAPNLLMLELTESELVDDPSQVMAVLTQLSEMGVRVAIDDFGTGWSSLSNLTSLPIHQVKIDRSFVSRMLAGGDDGVIVRSIIDLGHNLGLEVVAEGVEDRDTFDALRCLGCDQAQGYLVSRPMPPDELTPWLRSRETAGAR